MKRLIAIMFAATAVFSAVAQIPNHIQEKLDSKDYEALVRTADVSSWRKDIIASVPAAELKSIADCAIAVKAYHFAQHLLVYLKDFDSIRNMREKQLADGLMSMNGTNVIYIVSYRKEVDGVDSSLADRVSSKIIEIFKTPSTAILYVNELLSYDIAVRKAAKAPVNLYEIDDTVAKTAASYGRILYLKNPSSPNAYDRYYDVMFANYKSKTQKQLYKFAMWQHRNNTYAGKYDAACMKLFNAKHRITFAAYCQNADELLSALAGIEQNMLTADEVLEIITVLNGQKADWRADEVLVALKNINSMYTTKLYDDRDAWEPVLSKLRAMIEIR